MAHFLLRLFSLLLFAGVAFVAGYAVAARRMRARPGELAPPFRASTEPARPPSRVAYTRDAAEGTTAWRMAMLDVGERMERAGVRRVLFAHGSFVGDDPLAIARAVEESVPALPGIARALRGFTRAKVSRLVGDLSNFPAQYVDDFAEATGIPSSDFVWSGENHHAARVQGAVRLAATLARGDAERGAPPCPGNRLLLVGHSHGGQLFAILSQLVARAHGYEELLAAARARGEDLAALEDHLALLRTCRLDVVTFGTPPRYGWARGARFRLLHVVNHRGAVSRARSLRGLFHTRHGDYVHQLGGHGSDFPAPTSRDREINLRLDPILGEGTGLRAWLRHVSHGPRVSPAGRTVLVDYGDGAASLPNFWATGLGHAAYTRREAMLFHAQLIASELYPTRPAVASLWVARARGWIAPRRSPRRLLG